MSDVLVRVPTEMTLPIVHPKSEEEEGNPDPPVPPIRPIHGLQLFFLPYLLFYFFFSVLIAIEPGEYGLLGISGLSILALIVGRGLEKIYQKNPAFCRKIATGVLAIEVVIFFVWQISCIFVYA